MKHIYIVHGWTGPAGEWDACTALLAEQGIAATVLPVPGLSAPAEKPWTLSMHVEWLHQKVEAGGAEEVILIGHSHGGRIAVAYVQAHPERVSKLVLVNSGGLIRRHMPSRIKKFIVGGMSRTAKTAQKVISYSFSHKIFHRLIRAKDYEKAPPAAQETIRNLVLVDLKDTFKEIVVPTLIIWGKKDKVMPISDAHFMKGAIPRSSLVVIDDARHTPHATHPEQVAGAIAGFV